MSEIGLSKDHCHECAICHEYWLCPNGEECAGGIDHKVCSRCLLKLLDESYKLLNELQYVYDDPDSSISCCPRCYKPSYASHAPDCEVGKLLKTLTDLGFKR